MFHSEEMNIGKMVPRDWQVFEGLPFELQVAKDIFPLP